MIIKNIEKIFIDWSGPYSYNDILCMDNKKAEKYFNVRPYDSGLYQIYGSHPIYGDNCLIYIGKTEQSFRERLKEREVITSNSDSNNIQIYIGKLYQDSTEISKEDESLAISKAESLLIHYHTPAKNSTNINSFKYSQEDYSVINIGSYRQLQKEISTDAFTLEHKIYNKIDNIAKKLKINLIYNEEDGYGFFINDNLWFGLDYELWNYNTILVLESNKKENDLFKELDIFDDEQWYYRPIYGTEQEIIKELKKLINFNDLK